VLKGSGSEVQRFWVLRSKVQEFCLLVAVF